MKWVPYRHKKLTLTFAWSILKDSAYAKSCSFLILLEALTWAWKNVMRDLGAIVIVRVTDTLLHKSKLTGVTVVWEGVRFLERVSVSVGQRVGEVHVLTGVTAWFCRYRKAHNSRMGPEEIRRLPESLEKPQKIHHSDSSLSLHFPGNAKIDPCTYYSQIYYTFQNNCTTCKCTLNLSTHISKTICTTC